MTLKKISPFAVIVYFTLVFVLFRYLEWYADNPDTFQYIAIAKKYLHGDWTNAVNGYWSPLISWLLIIPVSIFGNAVLAFKILQLIIGVFVLFQWNRFLFATALTN